MILAGLLRAYRKRLLISLVLGVLSVGLNVTGTRLLGHATDLVIARASMGELGGVLAWTAVVYLVSGACWIVQGRVTSGVIQRTASDLRRRLARKLPRLPMRTVDGHAPGDLLTRMTQDVDTVTQSLQQTVNQVTNSGLLVLGVLGAMVWIDPLLALAAIVVVPVSIGLVRLIGRRSRPRFAAHSDGIGALAAHAESVYSGHDVVCAFGRQAETAAEFERLNREVTAAGTAAQRLSGMIPAALTLIGNLGYVAVAVLGGLRVLSGALTIGDLQAFVVYTRQFGGPLTNAATLSAVLQSGAASARRVLALLDEPEQPPDPVGAVVPADVRGRLVFQDVDFRYDPERPLIDGLNLTIEPGQAVAVIGPTGAGKTTLLNLLLRFHERDRGSITVDGVDIATMRRADLRRMFGVVPQDPWLFGGTVGDNIAYGRPGATRADVEAAARAAQVDHHIRTLPRGYDTEVGSGGDAISAGERQLTAVARAFLADPPVLILDEATSLVDPHTEVLVREAMRRLAHGRTSIVIAHRLSTLRAADRIVELRDGKVI